MAAATTRRPGFHGWFLSRIGAALAGFMANKSSIVIDLLAGEHRLYLERNWQALGSPAHGTRRKSRGACQFQGAEQSARVRPSGKTSAKVQAAFHESSWFVAL